MEGAFDGGIFVAVGTVYGVFADAGGVFGADRAGRGVGRVGGADQGAEIFHCIVFFKNGRHDGAAAHKFAEFAVKRALAVNGIKFAGLVEAQAGEFHRNDAKTRRVDHLKDVTDVAGAHSVGLDHGESAVACHCMGKDK